MQPSVLYNSSTPFLGSSTLTRAPLPSPIVRTVGTLFHRYKYPEVHFWGLWSSYFGVDGWSYGRWPCFKPHIGGIILYLLYSFGWLGLIAKWCWLQYWIDTTWQSQLLYWCACILHECRGVKQVRSSYLVWHCGGVGLLLDGKQKLTVGGGSTVTWLKSKHPINAPERVKIMTTALKWPLLYEFNGPFWFLPRFLYCFLQVFRNQKWLACWVR